ESDSILDLSAFTFSMAPEWDSRGPAGRYAVTISFFSDVDQWFTYQVDPGEHELKDQTALELAWQALHEQIPELGAGIEVIDTITPAGYYDMTRRKLGMVRGVRPFVDVFDSEILGHTTTLPNVFLVGDTISGVGDLAAVSHSALALANKLEVRK